MMEDILQRVLSALQDWKFVIAFTVGLLTVLYLYSTRNFGYFKSIGLSTPKPYPFVGSTYRLLSPTGPREGILELVKKHGKVFGVFQGNTPELVFADASYIKEVMITHGHIYLEHSKTSFGCEWVDRSLSNLEADEWKRVKKHVAPAFTIGKLKLMVDDIVDVSKDLAEHMMELTQSGVKTADMKPITAKFSMDAIARTVFGISINSFKNPNSDFIKYGKMVLPAEEFGFRTMLQLIHIVTPGFAKIFDLLGMKCFDTECLVFFEGIVDDLFKARENEIDQRNDFLALMVKARKLQIEQAEKGDVEKGIERVDILAAGFIFFTSGYSSISSGFCSSVYYLANHPDYQQKAYEEIENVLSKSNGEIDMNVMKEMTFLEMVVKESMRIATPIPLLDRVPTEDNVIKGVPVKKGQRVWIPAHAIHHLPEYYPEPEKFNPMRFENAKQTEHIWLPFGIGPRMCMGDQISMLVIKIGLLHLLRSFKFYPASGKEQLTLNAFSVMKAMASFELRVKSD